MTGYAAQIAESEAKLASSMAKLEEIEALKTLEPKLRRDIASLVQKIEDMKEAADAEKSENTFFEKEVEEEPVVVVKKQQPPAAPRDAEGERKAQLRAVNKKLKQIAVLKLKDDLDAAAQAKVASEPKLRRQVAALEAGETWVDSDQEEEEPAAAPPAQNFKAPAEEPEEPEGEDGSDDNESAQKLPTDPAEVEKRLKNLKKKLQQIAKLKEKGGALDAEAKQKVASEHRINQEVRALEEGKDEVVFMEKTQDDVRIEIEKKLKGVNKKLDQIKKLKSGSNLDADAQAKVDAEKTLRQEAGALQKQVADMNQAERDRVAKKLGWEAEQKKNGKK